MTRSTDHLRVQNDPLTIAPRVPPSLLGGAEIISGNYQGEAHPARVNLSVTIEREAWILLHGWTRVISNDTTYRTFSLYVYRGNVYVGDSYFSSERNGSMSFGTLYIAEQLPAGTYTYQFLVDNYSGYNVRIHANIINTAPVD